jgi:DNA-binding NarL/FixJ family response regulator
MKSGSPGPVRVFVVDDHPIVRAGVRLLVSGMPGYELVGETGRAVGAPEAAAAAVSDAVVLDLILGGGPDGVDLVSRMRAALPDAKLVVFSMHPEHLFAQRVLKAGADAYVMKGGDLSELQHALTRVVAGEIHVSDAMKRRMESAQWFGSHAEGPLSSLSDRELQVFLRLGSGLSSQQIAEELGVSVKTVSAHRENLKTKLGVGSAAELVRHAVAYVLGRGTPA